VTAEDALRLIVEAEESRRERRWQAEQDTTRRSEAPAATAGPVRK